MEGPEADEELVLLAKAIGHPHVFRYRGCSRRDSCVPSDHNKMVELRALSEWSEGQACSSPERHGSMTGLTKMQIDIR